MDLITIWIALLSLTIFLYVVLDGFSHGVALLFPFNRDEHDRDLMISSIAPVWDANQTWLVFGGSALFVAFPLIYGVLLSALYIPVFTLLYGLIFRGVSLEFRANASRGKKVWDKALFSGSLIAVIAQGFILGGVLSGTTVMDNRFAGDSFYWLNPFSFIIVPGLIAGYLLLGSAYLINKTTGPVQERAYTQAFRSAVAMLVFQILVVIITPQYYSPAVANWLSPPRTYFIWAFPVISLLAFLGLVRSLRSRREVIPFVFSVIFFFAGYAGLLATIFPYAVPPSISFYEAAAQRETLTLMFWGSLITLPLVIGYSVHSYMVFRGKVSAEDYHH